MDLGLLVHSGLLPSSSSSASTDFQPPVPKLFSKYMLSSLLLQEAPAHGFLFSLPRIFFLSLSYPSSGPSQAFTALGSPLRTSYSHSYTTLRNPKAPSHRHFYSTINNHLCAVDYLTIMFPQMALSLVGWGVWAVAKVHNAVC